MGGSAGIWGYRSQGHKPSSHCTTLATVGFTLSDPSQTVRWLLEQHLYGQARIGKCPVCLYLLFAESVLLALSTCDWNILSMKRLGWRSAPPSLKWCSARKQWIAHSGLGTSWCPKCSSSSILDPVHEWRLVKSELSMKAKLFIRFTYVSGAYIRQFL